MDLTPSRRAMELQENLSDFMDQHVYPAEKQLAQWREIAETTETFPGLSELRVEAKSRGLWNLYVPGVSDLSHLEYAGLAELTGRSPELAPAAINGAAPDSMNMIMLDAVATPRQRAQWLDPMLEGTTHAAFVMTEPAKAGSDAGNVSTSIDRTGEEYVINGHKWFAAGAVSPDCSLLLVVGVTAPDGPADRRLSVVVVPTNTPGVEIVRSLSVFGYVQDHAEIVFTDVRVPVDNLLGVEGGGMAVLQTRRAGARIQRGMRLVGVAERALEMTCRHTADRMLFGRPLVQFGQTRERIADSRLAIDQARLMGLRAAWTADNCDGPAVDAQLSAIKILASRTALTVLDRAIEVHGALGVSADAPLARWYSVVRALAIADGPEAAHLETVASHELARFRLEN